jgi:hypothetical protein
MGSILARRVHLACTFAASTCEHACLRMLEIVGNMLAALLSVQIPFPALELNMLQYNTSC